MALTELQKSRISFHLDYFNPDYMLQITRDTLIITLDEVQELQLVGMENMLDPSLNYIFEGQYLCSTTSLLGRVEAAYDKLNTDTVEDSLYVLQAGSVTLRGDELKKREALYRTQVAFLAQMVGGTDPNGYGRVGR